MNRLHFLLVAALIAAGCAVLPPCGKDFSYNEVTDKCYFFSAECAKFAEASELCAKMNANLTAIRSQQENQVVYDLAQLNFPAEERHFWVGGRVALTDPPQYVWLTGDDFAFHRLYEPFNCLQETCVAGSLSRNQWLATRCTQCFYFVCEAKREVITCPVGYTHFNKTNACYKFNADTADWEHQEAKCVEDAGHIASVHSHDELDFILNLAVNTTSLWLGARAQTHPDFQWSDNSMWDFTNWMVGVPRWETHKCLMAYGGTVWDKTAQGKWNEAICTTAYPAVCKYVGVQEKKDEEEFLL